MTTPRTAAPLAGRDEEAWCSTHRLSHLVTHPATEHHRDTLCDVCDELNDLVALREAEAAPQPQALDVERLARALHRLRGIELWKWFRPLENSGFMLQEDTSPEFAAAIAAAYARLAGAQEPQP